MMIVVLASGCATATQTPDVVFFLPGVAGDGFWYDGLKRGIREANHSRQVLTVHWGAPGPLFSLNFSNKSIHDQAERKLADALIRHRARFPKGRIDLIAHSAGCGVGLGALAKVPEELQIRQVVLLAPSVSPQYELSDALRRCKSMNVFTSTRDTTFLDWRTRHFGTYDRIKTKAAGHAGFDITTLPYQLAGRLKQHPFDESHIHLGNNGGHFGAASRRFVASHVAPLFK